MRNRTDHEGRKHDCSCKTGKCDRKALAKPRTLDLRTDGERLRVIAEQIFVMKTRADLSEADRADMWTFVRLIDGELPKIQNPEPAFVAGVFLGALRRRGIRTALDSKPAPTTVQPSALERERAAKESMQRESRDAWIKSTK